MAVNLLFRDQVTPYRKPSEESSPPPSPTSYHTDPELRSSLPLSLPAPSKPSPLNTNVTTTRPRLPGRQETPPSPPNSVLGGCDERLPTCSPMNTMGASSKLAQAVETPPNSFKGKITRAFRGGHKRGSSENSWSTSKLGLRKHKKANSNSTNTTTNPLALTHIQTASSRSSFLDEPNLAVSKQAFYTYGDNITQLSPEDSMGGTTKMATSAREVRIQIPQQSMEINSGNNDGSRKYYDYYTRSMSNCPVVAQDVSDIDGSPFLSQRLVPSLKSPEKERHDLPRKETLDTQSSSESRERWLVEDAVARGFEAFNFGVPGGGAATMPQISGIDSDMTSRFVNPINRRASSSILNYPTQSYPSISGTSSSLARKGTDRSFNIQPPAPNMDISSSSFFISGQTISAHRTDGHTPERITQELRRLSKVSAGSGVSGLAIIVTADGPTSTCRSAESDDDDYYEGQRWTKEEKGKARAVSTVPSGTHDQRSHTRTLSGQSEWTTGTDRTHHSDENHDDSKSLLPAAPEIIQSRKLRAQEPDRDALVHQGDLRYEFTYRMRRTADDSPIFVPQYRYDSPLSFPNRNALGPPTLSRPPKSAERIFSSASLADRMGGSILKRPPSAVLRSPPTAPFSSIPQGDNAYDTHPRTSHVEEHRGILRHHNDTYSHVHPALRNLSKKPEPPRDGGSISSLGEFGHAFRSAPFNGLRSGSDIAGSAENSRNMAGRVDSNHFLQPPQEIRRSSWDPTRFLGQLPVRPGRFMRRSLTPHLYSPQDIVMDDVKYDRGFQGENTVYRQRQRKIGRLLLAFCVLFPPLWFVMACGGFDSFVLTWTTGEVRGVGGIERRIALVLATLVGLGAIVGVVVGVSTAVTTPGVA